MPSAKNGKGNPFGHPHFHPNDRYIVVLQGNWWVGSGTKFDPDGVVWKSRCISL
jgi:hypothetical protein